MYSLNQFKAYEGYYIGMLIAHYKTIPTKAVSTQTFPQTMTLSCFPTIPFYCSFIVDNFNDRNVSISEHKTEVSVSMLLALLSYLVKLFLFKLHSMMPDFFNRKNFAKFALDLTALDRFSLKTNRSKGNYSMNEVMVTQPSFEFRNTRSQPTF